MIRLYPFFAYASGPATGLPLADIKVTILRIKKADMTVETVVDAQAAQSEIGKGYYAYGYDVDLSLYDYLPFVEYVGSEPVSPRFYSGDKLDADVSTRVSQGPGATPWTGPQVIDQETGLPIADVSCWITTDIVGANVIAGTLLTNAQGYVTFLLNPGPYYFWKMKNGYNFTNPTLVVV